ncbi:MAG: hypothetical protein KA206_02615 [Paludibacter sp.]|nr:hypothetical protein [Paludibacter sp.]
MVSRNSLLLLTGILWSIGGGVLMFRGVSAILLSGTVSVMNILITIASAILFYVFLFRRISSKHIARIEGMPADKYPFYIFLSAKSYLIMLLMIVGGVSLRSTGIIPFSVLMYFYPVMGSVLIVSAIRFYYHMLRN